MVIPLSLDAEMDGEVSIAGGGPAGLSAALTLLKAGMRVRLFDPGPYPRHRVCGEFFSPECRPLLEELGLPTREVISHLLFTSGQRHFEMYLDEAAVGLSRERFDAALLERCRSVGGTRFEWHAEKLHALEPGRRLVLACGRHSRLAQQLWNFPAERGVLPWLGFKFHAQLAKDLRGLELHFFDGGYVGFSPIEDGRMNVCGLVRTERLKNDGGVKALLDRAALDNPLLRRRVDGLALLFEPLTVAIPDFGARPLPLRPGLRVSGDMAGSIAPLAGEGLSMALRSGQLAAESFLKNESEEDYQRRWEAVFGAPLRWGQRLQGCLLSRRGQALTLQALKLLPPLGPFFFGRTRRRDWATI